MVQVDPAFFWPKHAGDWGSGPMPAQAAQNRHQSPFTAPCPRPMAKDSMTKTALVIGAGITGVSTALWLRRAGIAVTLIDRVPPGDAAQTSYGNAGLLARAAITPIIDGHMLAQVPRMLLDPQSPLFLKWRYLPQLFPFLLPMLRACSSANSRRITEALLPLTEVSVDAHFALAHGSPAAAFLRRGDYAYYYRNEQAYRQDAPHNELLREMGFTVQTRDHAGMLAADPALGPRYGFAAIYPDHGWLSAPGDYVAALAAQFQAEGGKFRRASVRQLGNGSVQLDDGETLTADKIVLSAGAWSGRLAAQLGLQSRLETERGYHLFLKGASHKPAHPFMVSDAKFVVTPMRDGLRCAGIVEFGGLDLPPSRAPLALLKRRIRQVYPDLTWESAEEWMGFRPTTPDSLPHLGPIPGAPNVIAAFGSQHIGITIGPRLGRLAADLVLGQRSNLDLTPYRCDRFQ